MCSCGGAAGSDPEVNAEQQRQGDGMLMLVFHTFVVENNVNKCYIYYIYKMYNMGTSENGPFRKEDPV